MPYSWEIDEMYMILNPSLNEKSIEELSKIYQNIKKMNQIKNYSSNDVETISKDELKKIIPNAGLL